MKVVWTNKAINDLKEIFEYYEIEVGGKVALNIIQNIKLKAKMLKDFPEIGRKEPEFGKNIRSIRLDNYRIFHKIESDIFIMTIFDMRRNPKDLHI